MHSRTSLKSQLVKSVANGDSVCEDSDQHKKNGVPGEQVIGITNEALKRDVIFPPTAGITMGA